MTYKNKFPFRIGCTSYVIPDRIIPNVIEMANVADDIELLFFESSESCQFLSKEERKDLYTLANSFNLTYSVHCPTDILSVNCDNVQIDNFIFQLEQIINQTLDLPVSGYIIHLDDFSGAERNQQILNICNSISRLNNIDNRIMCIENLAYDPFINYDIVKKFNFSACIDMGHLWLYEQNWSDFCVKMLPFTKIFHLHGVSNFKDHRSLANADPHLLVDFIGKFLTNYSNVLTIELFKKETTLESFEILRRLWEQLHL